MSAFSLWLYNLVLPKIKSANTPTKHGSNSLREATVSSNVLNFRMFAHSTTFISQFDNFKTGGFD